MATCPRCGDNLCQTHYDKVYERWCETRECLQRQNKKLQSELAAKADELLAQAALVVELRARATRAEGELKKLQPLVEAAKATLWQVSDSLGLAGLDHAAGLLREMALRLEDGAEEGGDE